MMRNLTRRGEDLARAWQQQRLRDLAAQLSSIFGRGWVEVRAEQVVVRGRSLAKRWLLDPALRFLGAVP